MKPAARKPLVDILFPVWLVLIFLFFVLIPGMGSYIHRSTLAGISLLPVKLGRINGWEYIKDILLSIVGIVIFTIANFSAGLATLKIIRINNWLEQSDSKSLRLAYLGTAFLVGHGFFSLFFMTLGLLGWLKPIITGTALTVGFISGLAILQKMVFPWVKTWHVDDLFTNKRERVFLALGIVIICFTLFYSSARLSYDSVAVYFSDAKITALTGKIQYFTEDTFVVSIFQTAIQYSAIIQLFGDQTARLFSWIHGVVIIIFSILIAEQAGMSRKARLYLFLLLVTSTAFVDLFSDGKVDLASFSPIMAAIYWVLVDSRSNTTQKSLLFLVGFLIGLSFVARPFNVILAGGFLGLYYLQYTFLGAWKLESHSIRRLLNSVTWIGLGTMGVGAFHLVANWLLLGSPLAMITNTAVVTPSNWQWAIDQNQMLLIRLLYPFTVSYLNTTQSLGTISPLFIGFLPILFAKAVRSKVILSREICSLSIISAFVLLTWIFLFFTVMEIRYVFFLWIILFMPLSEVIAQTFENGTRVAQTISAITTFFLLGFIAFRIVFIAIDTYSPIDARGNPQCNDSRFCEFLKPINQSALPGDRVLTISAYRYYLRTDLFSCSTTHDEYKRLQALSEKSNSEFWEEVYRQGYKYIAYENDYTTRHLKFAIIPSPSNTPNWIKLEPLFRERGNLQIAYKIHVSRPPLTTRTTCQENSSGGWEIYSPAP